MIKNRQQNVTYDENELCLEKINQERLKMIENGKESVKINQ